MIADLKPYAEYKESGSRWLANVPSHWEVRKLRTLIRPRNERNRSELPLLSVAREKGVFVRSLTDADENHNVIPEDLSNYKVARAGNLVINKMKAWQGSMGIAPSDGIVSPAYFVFDFDIADRAFGQALLRSKPYVAHFGQASDGVRVGQWDLTIAGMRQIPVLAPPPAEQAAIVRFLDYANRRIERFIRAKRKLIVLLNEQKQGIIFRAITRGVDHGVRMKPSGVEWLGDVPEHWELIRLKYVSPEITVGVVVNPSSYFVDEGVPILLGNNVLPGGFRLDHVRRVTPDSNRIQLKKSQLRAGDVVVVRVGAPGVAAVIPPELDGCNCASMVIVRRGNKCEPLWMEHLFNSPVMRRQIDMVKYGAAQKQFNISHAVDFLALLPSLEEQRRTLDYLTSELRRIDAPLAHITRQIDLIREYRTRLIADVVTGKLDAREAAARLPEEAPADIADDDTDLSIDPEALFTGIGLNEGYPQAINCTNESGRTKY